MPNHHLASPGCTAALALGLAFMAMPAYAGFQWVDPADTSAYAPAVNAVPRADSADMITPIIITGKQTQQIPAPPAAAPIAQPAVAPEMPTAPVFSIPSAAAPLPAHEPVAAPEPFAPPAPAKEETAVPPTTDLAAATISVAIPSGSSAPGPTVVQGFASQIPLTLGLRQLLPPGYTFSIDQNVNMETRVSYRGGKPWEETLATMLGASGLSYRLQGNVVIVSCAGGAPAVAETPWPSRPVMPEPIVNRAPKMMAPTNILPTPSSDVPVLTVAPFDGWAAERGDTLRKVLLRWCDSAGVEMKWVSEYDYPIEASARFNTDFENAVRGLLAGFEGASPQPVGELHANPTASHKVLVVQTRGNRTN